MTISQKSLAVGLVVVVLALTGSVVAWRKSLGFLAVTWWLSVFAYAAVSGAIGVRTRYLISLMPVLFLILIWGVMWWCVKIASLAKKTPLDEKKLAAVATIFVIVIGVFNLPRDFKLGIAGAAQSYGDDYYKHLRKGEFVDLMKVSAMLSEEKDGASIYATDVSRLHYLSGKIVRPLPSYDIKTEAEAAGIIELALSPQFSGYIVIDLEEERAGEVTAKLDADPRFKMMFSGKYIAVYKK